MLISNAILMEDIPLVNTNINNNNNNNININLSSPTGNHNLLHQQTILNRTIASDLEDNICANNTTNYNTNKSKSNCHLNHTTNTSTISATSTHHLNNFSSSSTNRVNTNPNNTLIQRVHSLFSTSTSRTRNLFFKTRNTNYRPLLTSSSSSSSSSSESNSDNDQIEEHDTLILNDNYTNPLESNDSNNTTNQFNNYISIKNQSCCCRCCFYCCCQFIKQIMAICFK